MITSLNAQLVQWGEWLATHHGYSKRSPEAKALLGSAQPCTSTILYQDMPRHIKELDRAVQALSDRHRELGQAVRLRYCVVDGRFLSAEDQVGVWAKRSGRGMRHYYHCLDKAHIGIDMWMLR